jgi:hypothetical protein
VVKPERWRPVGRIRCRLEGNIKMGQQVREREVWTGLDLGHDRDRWRTLNTVRTGFLNCLNARSRGLTFRHRASCI